MFKFLTSGLAGGNDANEFAFELDMHDIERTSTCVATDYRIARFFIARCIDQLEERIEKYFGRFFKNDVVLALVAFRLVFVPDEQQAIEFETDIHKIQYALLYCICQYKMNLTGRLHISTYHQENRSHSASTVGFPPETT